MITQQRLKEVLSYDPNTGEFRWLIRPAKNVHIGSIAGSINSKQYRDICIDKKRYSAHRLAWLYIYGQWPTKLLDHINQVRDDNRISNLRECDYSQNGQNRKLNSNNSTGYPGVYYNKAEQKYIPRIRIKGKTIHFGLYNTAKEAYEAYKRERAKHFIFHPTI